MTSLVQFTLSARMGGIVSLIQSDGPSPPCRPESQSMSVACEEQDDNEVLFRVLLSDPEARAALLTYLKLEHSDVSGSTVKLTSSARRVRERSQSLQVLPVKIYTIRL